MKKISNQLLSSIEESLGFNLNHKQLAYLKGDSVVWQRQEGKTTVEIVKLLFEGDSPIYLEDEARKMANSIREYEFYKHEIYKMYKLFEGNRLSPRPCFERRYSKASAI